MDYLILDTNILIDLYEEESKEMINNIFAIHLHNNIIHGGIIHLLIPEQVLKEWEHYRTKDYRKKIDQLDYIERKVMELLGELPSFDTKGFQSEIAEAKKMELRKFKYGDEYASNFLDGLLRKDDFATIIYKDEKVDNKVIDLGLKSEEPFFSNKKKEFGDAIIFFSAYYHLLDNKEKINTTDRVFFFTNNKKDFSEDNNASKIHKKLEPYFREVNIEYNNNLKRYLENLIKKYKLDIAKEFELGKVRDEYLSDNYFVECPSCNEEVHINVDTTVKTVAYSHHPQHYFYVCPNPKCGNEWDTGDSIIDHIY